MSTIGTTSAGTTPAGTTTTGTAFAEEVSANGLRFHTLRLGASGPERPKVVMVHGLVVDNLSSFYYTIANAVAMHAEVYLYDLRGHGLSSIPGGTYRCADHLADLLALLDHWQIAEPVHVVGNSYGGLIALQLARRHPERVASLFLVEAHFPIEGWGEQMVGTVSLAAYGLDDESTKKWMAENAGRKIRRLAMRANRLARDTTIMADLIAERPFPLEALRAIRRPVVAVYGEHSDIVERGRDLERHLPDVSLHLIPDSEHGLLHESAHAVRERAVDWITDVAARQAAERV